MYCFTHPDADASQRCAGCAEPFCENCLVEVHGQHYCQSCKMMTIKHPPVLEGSRFRCRDAQSSMVCSMVAAIGILGSPLFGIAGIILSLVALVKAASARKMLKRDPRLTGSGMALGGTILGAVNLILSLLMMILTIQIMSTRH